MHIIKSVFSLLFSLISFLSIAQIYDPVDWSFNKKGLGNNEFELYFKATIEDGWHLYSQNLPSDEGPIATAFDFKPSDAYELIGNTQEPTPLKEYDPNFDMELTFFGHEVTFTQKVKLLKPNAKVEGELTFMVCDDKMCLPPDYIDFSFDLKGEATESKKAQPTSTPVATTAENTLPEIAGDKPQIFDPVDWEFNISTEGNGNYTISLTATIEEGWHLYALELPRDDGPIATEINFFEPDGYALNDAISVNKDFHTEYDPNFMMDLNWYEGEVTFSQKITATKTTKVKGEVYYMACNNERCITPQSEEFEFEVTGDGATAPTIAEDSPTKKTKTEGRSIWAIFILSFLGGFAALLTPCVFPMIPLTVSFFTKQSKNKAKGLSNAILYGLAIIFIYVLLGFGVTMIFGADALNALSTNVYFNIFFFILLTVFAISFFGAFEITLPNSWINKVDRASDKGGLLGIFFMAFTLSLVSFSCTGPIIGTLLVEAAVQGGVAGPLIGMFGFSLALAMPFALFAAFPGWLNSLPKSGGWLNSVKVVLGFLELALALKFLSNADLVIQAGYITREVFIAIWIGIFLMLSLYLIGAYQMPHDSPLQRLSVGRVLFATLSIIFTFYLIPGLWGAPLKVISGFPPPMFYSESPQGVGGSATVVASHGESTDVVGDPAHCPHNLNCFHDYDEGVAYAKEVGKPIMLDFTGWACVNCRKMEEQVWSDPRVLEKLRNDVVLISLYVDEKLELPKEEQMEVTIGNKTKMLKTIGNKWSYFQASKFKTNSQPFYVILDHEGNQMHESAAYDPDIELFVDWLDTGVDKFKKEGVKG